MRCAGSGREAKDFASEIRIKVRNGSFNTEEPGRGADLQKFSSFFDTVYLPYSKENKGTWKHDEFRGEVLKDFFSGRAFSEIKPLLVASFINNRLKTKTRRGELRNPVTVYKEVQLLSSVFNMAIREGATGSNPCVTIPTATKRKIWAWNKRERFLSPDEEVKLFAQLKGRRARLAPIVRFELETGLRKSELCRLEVRHVNLSTKVRSFKIHGQIVYLGPNELLVEKSKNGKARVIPLTPGARRIAEFQIADATTGKYLFTSYRTGGMITEIKTGFTAAVRDARLEDFRFHDLRHTFATRLNEGGADLATIRDLLGHSSTKMASDYTQTSLETRRRAIEAMSRGKCRPKLRQNYGKTC